MQIKIRNYKLLVVLVYSLYTVSLSYWQNTQVISASCLGCFEELHISLVLLYFSYIIQWAKLIVSDFNIHLST